MDLERFRAYTEWHDFANEKRYDAPADPWKLLPVDPTAVTCYNHEVDLNWGLGRVEAGEWDNEENCTRLDETTTYRGLTQRFEKGYDWEETAQYRRAKAQFENGNTFRGYESVEEYRDVRCEHVDELFRSIEQGGYRPNEAATHETPTQDNPFEDAYANHLEPLVAIGRSGEIYWCEGIHRLAIASILGLDDIPVYVLCRHAHWQRVRDRVHGTTGSDLRSGLEVPSDHPDLRDVLS